MIYACLLSRRQSWCEVSRPCGEQSGASGADVELTVCARPAPLDTCQGLPQQDSLGPGLPGAGPCVSRAESAKPELRVPQVQAPPCPEPAPGRIPAADGRCLPGVTRRRSAGEDRGRGSHRSAARRPLEGCGDRPWASAARREGSSACPRSRHSPVPLRARPVSCPLSLHLSMSLSVSPSLCLCLSLPHLPSLSHTHCSGCISKILYDTLKKNVTPLTQGNFQGMSTDSPVGGPPVAGGRSEEGSEQRKRGEGVPLSRTRGDMAADTSPRKTDVIPAAHAMFRGVRQAGMTVCDLQSRRFKPVEVK